MFQDYVLGRINVWSDGGIIRASFRFQEGGIGEIVIDETDKDKINEKINGWVDKGYDVIVGPPYREIKT